MLRTHRERHTAVMSVVAQSCTSNMLQTSTDTSRLGCSRPVDTATTTAAAAAGSSELSHSISQHHPPHIKPTQTHNSAVVCGWLAEIQLSAAQAGLSTQRGCHSSVSAHVNSWARPLTPS